MLFHDVVGTGIAAGASAPKTEVKTRALVWAGLLIVLFVVAAFVAHGQASAAGETVFLNLSVAITSASVGAFLGEKLAINRLAR